MWHFYRGVTLFLFIIATGREALMWASGSRGVCYSGKNNLHRSLASMRMTCFVFCHMVFFRFMAQRYFFSIEYEQYVPVCSYDNVTSNK